MISRNKLADTIRVLSMDAVQKAGSGHPGAPMGMADIAEVLWRDFLKHNPTNPNWPDRDRFILSNGHGSMLIYSLLHLSGYDLTMADIQSFRQLHAKTAGHPEYGYAPGIETTTGPLGQGITNGVGMALAEKVLADQFNRPGHDIVDHHTYVFMGDGCMMEGISHEACSLAGTLGLGKLIAFWDDNGISIDGEVEGWFSDDTPKRFEAYGWHVIADVDGHNAQSIRQAILEAQAETSKPTLICCKTIIGFGSPNKSASHDCHGAPLGEEEVALVRQNLGWEYAPFEIPHEIYQAWDAKVAGKDAEAQWANRFVEYESAYPELAAEFNRRVKGDLPENWAQISEDVIKTLQAKPATIATRKASQNAIEAFGAHLPEFLGGSADLTPSNLTNWSGSKAITAQDASGNYLSYGVREFAMSAMMNGIALHGGFIPYGGTFLMFMEYARNALRMAALMKQRSIFVYTHDSIGLGEDGPTHQPVEQIASLRLTPNMSTWRPCDQVETAVAWKAAVERTDGPTSLIFSRQNLVQFERDEETLENIAKGGYILSDCDGEPELILIATGSEVALAMEAKAQLNNVRCRVVSMPATDVFDAQSAQYQQHVLPTNVTKRIAIEAGIRDYWFKYAGLQGEIIGMTSFGESAPADQLFEMYGFTVANVVDTAKRMMENA
ncbi:transketolase [Vibrio harveyi]|uniref:Transketolase n=1 Tax=Vibrio harveyi TaxID=669 RepID=A0A8B3DIQ1_VIBHA|nr:transketolase [Vibrio harveyi]ELZ1715958.1 transketolase [Vibrio parahaemolyticus]EKO3845403.1 transketolase [Vibrio harveyi]EKO3862224.1 transketolase [Vibrio harveyi]ELH7810536.1 transketolase [Vibrio harveyi]ELV8772457.1 transketolase [Vibrio harveyi]